MSVKATLINMYSSMNERTNQIKEHDEKSHDPYIMLIYLALCSRGNVMMYLCFSCILPM